MTNPWIYDIDKIIDFIFEAQNDRSNDIEINETYVFDEEEQKMVPTSKEVKEVKYKDFTNQNTIRYDMVKMFIETLDSIEDEKVMSIGQRITLNTMKVYELIKEIKNSDDE